METLHIDQSLSKEEKYKSLLPQIEGLISSEKDTIANLANVAAVIYESFDFLWVGFYLQKGKELVLGPFQGPLACTRIQFGRGVCGKSWEINQPIIVPNVDEFADHIACSSLSKSEIVIPFSTPTYEAIIFDLDSEKLADFDETDQKYLQKVCDLLNTYCVE
ncbi:MAG: GAF domain-containing protein [Crocinitomicaceae bacterium]|nr:GAF domain-containing protein [Crocinitomicaceae bacterium]